MNVNFNFPLALVWHAVGNLFDVTDVRLQQIKDAQEFERARSLLKTMAREHARHQLPGTSPRQVSLSVEIAHDTLRVWWSDLSALFSVCEEKEQGHDDDDWDPGVLVDQLQAAHDRAKQQMRDVTDYSHAPRVRDACQGARACSPCPDEILARERMNGRDDVLRELAAFATSLTEPTLYASAGIPRIRWLKLISHDLRDSFLKAKVRENNPGEFAATVDAWDQQTRATLDACLLESRPLRLPESRQILVLLKAVIEKCTSWDEFMTRMDGMKS
jgi:hypothetical protein